MDRPRLLLTMGDVAGGGPEGIAKAWPRLVAGSRARARALPRVLYDGQIAVPHVTLHVALRDVFARLTTAAVLEKIRLLDGLLRRLKGAAPRLGVAALNPHASDGGLFGDEEDRII